MEYLVSGIAYVWGVVAGAVVTSIPFGTEIVQFVNAINQVVNPYANPVTDLTGQPIVPWFIQIIFFILVGGIIAYGITILRGN